MTIKTRFGSLLVVALVSACNPATVYELYNNSGSSITINNCDGDKFILPDETGAISACEPDTFAILAAEKKWTYSRGTLPSYFDAGEYVRTRVTSGNVMKLQLEPNGTILAVRVESASPIAQDHPQPIGFPLKPGRLELLR